MKKVYEYTYGLHIYMEIEYNGRLYAITNYAGLNGAWDTYKTSADNDPIKRKILIKLFNKLY